MANGPRGRGGWPLALQTCCDSNRCGRLSRTMKSNLEIDIYFSDFFQVAASVVERYGAFDISLVNDLPLFIDPFLLFNSRKRKYRRLHDEVIRYLSFLRDKSLEGRVDDGLL